MAFSTSALTLGSHPVTAAYVGDVLNAASTSAVVTQNVRELTQNAILSSINPAQPGALVTLTASFIAAGPGTPTGTVTFNEGGTVLGTEVLSTTSGITTATYATSSLALGAHSITAVYAGDTLNAPSTSETFTQDVAQVTTVEIASTSNPVEFGGAITLTATVTPANSGTPTGALVFMEGSTTLGTETLSGSATASISLPNLSPAQHSFTASYGGDTTSDASTSTVFIQTVQQTTTTALSVDVNPSISGNSITLTATVTPAASGTPAGSVAFNDGNVTLGSATVNASGVATLTTSTLTAGSHSIAAVYAGDPVNLSSTSTALTQKVSQNTSIILTASRNPVQVGTIITFIATVVPGTPTGTVSFQTGNATLGTVTLASGAATFATQGLNLGSQSITASYSGDANNAPSTSSLTLTVVSQTVPVITWATPAAISFGTALSSTQLDATASVPGTFVYSPAAGTIPVAGSDTLSVTFTPTNTADYTTATASVTLIVNNKTTPTVNWAPPAAIAFGTTLSSTQLDAAASVPGTFVYSPAAGTTPADGTDTLSVTFTPTDTTDYNTATASVTLTVEGFTLSENGVSTQTVTAGGAATFKLTVAPVGSTTLPLAVNLTVSGLPPGATYTFSPTVIPAGSPATTVNLIIQTSSSSAAWNTEPQGYAPHSGMPILLTLLLLPLLGMQWLRQRMQTTPRLLAAVLFTALSLGGVVGLSGCASRGGDQVPPGGATYTLVVTETCGTLTHSFDLTLVVQK